MSMTVFFGVLLLLVSNKLSVADTNNKQCNTTAEAVLKKLLFCGYDKTSKPTLHQATAVNVSFFVWLNQIGIDETRSKITIYGWTVMTWEDQILKWTPHKHNDLSTIRVDSESIWVPDVAVYTMAYTDGVFHRIPRTICVVEHTGETVCAPPSLYTSLCSPDLTRWPFDNLVCMIEIGSWSFAEHDLNITFQDKGVYTDEYVKNEEWDLLNIEMARKERSYGTDTFPYLQLDFHFKRHSGAYAATVIIPTIVLSLVTLLMFFLEPASAERLHLGSANILAHCLYLQYLGVKVPSNGDSTPVIVVFFRDSMLLMGFSLMFAIILRCMVASKRVPPTWITSVVDWVHRTPPGQLLYNDAQSKVSTDEENGAESSPQVKSWRLAAVLLDRLCFFIFALSFIILLKVFLP